MIATSTTADDTGNYDYGYDGTTTSVVGEDSNYETYRSIYAIPYYCNCETYVIEKYNVKPEFPKYQIRYQQPVIATPRYHHRRMICKSGFLARKGKARKRGKA